MVSRGEQSLIFAHKQQMPTTSKPWTLILKNNQEITINDFPWSKMGILEFEEWEEEQWEIAFEIGGDIKTEYLNHLLIAYLADLFDFQASSITIYNGQDILPKYRELIQRLFYTNNCLKQVYLYDYRGPAPAELMEMVVKHPTINTLSIRLQKENNPPTFIPVNNSIQLIEIIIKSELEDDCCELLFEYLGNCKGLLVLDITIEAAPFGLENFVAALDKFICTTTLQVVQLLGKVEEFLTVLGNAKCRVLRILRCQVSNPDNVQEFCSKVAANPYLSVVNFEVNMDPTNIFEMLKQSSNWTLNFTLNKFRITTNYTNGFTSSFDRVMLPIFYEATAFNWDIVSRDNTWTKILIQNPEIRQWSKNLVLLSRKLLLLCHLLPFQTIIEMMLLPALDYGIYPHQLYQFANEKAIGIIKRLLDRKSIGTVYSPYKFGITELDRVCLCRFDYEKNDLGTIIANDLKLVKKSQMVVDGDSDFESDSEDEDSIDSEGSEDEDSIDSEESEGED